MGTCPCLDQEQGNRTGGMNGEATNPGINTGVAPLAALGVSGMGAQGADDLDNRGKPAKGGPNVAGYQRVEVAAIRGQAERPLHGVEKALHVLLRGQRLAKLDKDRTGHALDRRTSGRNRIFGIGFDAAEGVFNNYIRRRSSPINLVEHRLHRILLAVTNGLNPVFQCFNLIEQVMKGYSFGVQCLSR